jgi:hypothetical protein
MRHEKANGKARLVSATSIALLGFILAGCGTPTDLQRASTNERIGAVKALVLPPPGGPSVVDVVERRYSNAIQQDVALSAASNVPGQNLLRVQLFGPMGTEAGQTSLSNLPITETTIQREMRAAFPGVAMQRSPLYAQNSFGPFGYAVGRSGRDLCLYAWQRVTGPTRAAPFSPRGTMQTRLRLCQTGASEEALLSVMYGYTVTGGFPAAGWNPFGPPPPPDPRLGVTGKPVFPAVPQRMETVLEPEPEPIRRPASRRAAAPAPAPAPAQVPITAPVVRGPIVPPPPSAATAVPIVPAPPTVAPAPSNETSGRQIQP